MVTSFLVRIEFCFQEIREKDVFQDDENDEKLDEDDDP
jgi:hypothetical protein